MDPDARHCSIIRRPCYSLTAASGLAPWWSIMMLYRRARMLVSASCKAKAGRVGGLIFCFGEIFAATVESMVYAIFLVHAG